MALKDKVYDESNAALEKLNERAEQGKLELENLLLKQALAKSSENCEKLLTESRDVLQRAEKNRRNENIRLLEHVQKLDKLVSNLQSQNELLADHVDAAVLSMKDEILNVVQQDVKQGLSLNIEIMNRAAGILEDRANTNATTMESHLKAYKRKQEKFFEMDGMRSYVFWIGQIATAVNLLLLIYLLFFK